MNEIATQGANQCAAYTEINWQQLYNACAGKLEKPFV
jgi:hypothetical protein